MVALYREREKKNCSLLNNGQAVYFEVNTRVFVCVCVCMSGTMQNNWQSLHVHNTHKHTRARRILCWDFQLRIVNQMWLRWALFSVPAKSCTTQTSIRSIHRSSVVYGTGLECKFLTSLYKWYTTRNNEGKKCMYVFACGKYKRARERENNMEWLILGEN